MLILLRSIQGHAAGAVAVAAGVAVHRGDHGDSGIPFNFANIIALPLLFGLGVDNGIHMAHRLHYLQSARGTCWAPARRKGCSIGALTTMFSFVSLAFTRHRGTASHGHAAGDRLAALLICALVVLPAFSTLRFRRKQRGGAPEPCNIPKSPCFLDEVSMSTLIADCWPRIAARTSSCTKNTSTPRWCGCCKTIGYDRVYTRATGAYLYDAQGNEYLDLLSGFGVFALGRNHPAMVMRRCARSWHADLPDLVQMDVSLLSGLLAERILALCPPQLSKMFFCNSGAEADEAAIKFARYTTRREKILYCEHGFHGSDARRPIAERRSTYSATASGRCCRGAWPCRSTTSPPWKTPCASKDVAAFIVEPIQGKGVNIPSDNYLPEAANACAAKYGTLLVADEMQTGLGRTGKFWAIEHWGVEPDMILMAKALSGGFVPVGAVAMTAAGSWKRCSTAWTGPSCMARPFPRTTWRWRRASPR